MLVIDLLVAGKTDTELLNAIVAALTDNDEDLIEKLRSQDIKGYGNRNTANIEVVAAIVSTVNARKAKQETEHG